MREPHQLPPFPIKLQSVAAVLKLGVRTLAKAASVSTTAMHSILAHDAWPKRADRAVIERGLLEALTKAGAKPTQLRDVFAPVVKVTPKSKAAGTCAKAASHPPTSHHNLKEDDNMLLGKQSLTQEARKAFGLFGNPFDGEVTSADEMFQNNEFRYCREAAWQAANHGRFMAVVGESGAGKTTLLGDLEDRIAAERRPIIMIKPAVLGMEDSEKTGKTLKMVGILEAIICRLDPTASPKMTVEGKVRQVTALLETSAKAGQLHLVVIEEAHCLPTPTLKHLKRLHELRLGRKPLLGILLVAQPELRKKLNPTRADLREVTQRCEIVELLPLDSDLRGYLQTRLKRVDKSVADIMDDQAVEAVQARLTQRTGKGSQNAVSQVYPLAVNNFMTMCMNQAAELGAPRVTRDIVMAV